MPDTFGIIGLTDGIGGAVSPSPAAKSVPGRKKKQEQAEQEEEAQGASRNDGRRPKKRAGTTRRLRRPSATIAWTRRLTLS